MKICSKWKQFLLNKCVVGDPEAVILQTVTVPMRRRKKLQHQTTPYPHSKRKERKKERKKKEKKTAERVAQKIEMTVLKKSHAISIAKMGHKKNQKEKIPMFEK